MPCLVGRSIGTQCGCSKASTFGTTGLMHTLPYLVQRSANFKGPRVLLALKLKPHAAAASATTTDTAAAIAIPTRGRGALSRLPVARPIPRCNRTGAQHVRQPWGRLHRRVPYVPYDSAVGAYGEEGLPGNQVAGAGLQRAGALAGVPPSRNS